MNLRLSKSQLLSVSNGRLKSCTRTYVSPCIRFDHLLKGNFLDKTAIFEQSSKILTLNHSLAALSSRITLKCGKNKSK